MYKIIGTDGKEYGPISGEQLRQWIAEGRVESRTPVFVDGAKEWTFVGLLPEFAAFFAAGAPPKMAPTAAARGSSSFASWGLICGILSWVPCCCCYGFPCNVFGLIFSLIGLSQISRHPELYEGRGAAIAGLVLSALSILFFGFLILLSIATDNFQVNDMRF